MSVLKLMTWEEFIYEFSALGFRYNKGTRSWHRYTSSGVPDGASASDEALRDLHAHWPVMLSAALKLFAEGKKTVSVECGWENDSFVARLKVVE